MTPLEMIDHIVTVHDDNRNDDEGDKFLSDPTLAIEAIDTVLHSQDESDISRLRRSGWLPTPPQGDPS